MTADTDRIIEALECFRLKCRGEILCGKKECPYRCDFDGSERSAYCAFNKLLFEAEQKLKAQKEQIEKLHKGIAALRDSMAKMRGDGDGA